MCAVNGAMVGSEWTARQTQLSPEASLLEKLLEGLGCCDLSETASQFLHYFPSPEQWADTDLSLSTSSLSVLLCGGFQLLAIRASMVVHEFSLVCSRQNPARLVYTMSGVVWASWLSLEG